MRAAKGSIVKLGHNRYRVQISVTDPVTGKRLRPSETVRGSARKAEEAKIRMLAAAVAGEYASMMTLADYTESVFLPAFRKSKVKESSVDALCTRLNLYVLPQLGSESLSDLTPRTLRPWAVSFDTVSKQFAAYISLRQVLNHAVKNEYMTSNPLDKVEKPKPDPYEPQVLDIEDIEVYLWHFKDTEVEPAVLLAIGAGFRRGEIIALNVDDINLVTGRVTVDDAITQHGTKIYEGDPKSRFGVRVVYLPETITARLRVLLDGMKGPILTEGDKRMQPDRLSKLYKRLLDVMPQSVTRVTLKNLRHTSLTLAYDSGADSLGVSRRGGHSSTDITERYYLRPKKSRDKGIAEAMDKALKRPAPASAKMCQSKRITKTFEVIRSF